MSDEDRRRWWDAHYSRLASADPGPAGASREAPPADPWALRELDTLPDVHDILDLGCGPGHTAELLHRAGYRVHATDISPVALRALRERAPGITTSEIDHSQPLPFGDDAFDAVVADLSLHYFATDVTGRILAEIARVLRPAGSLLLRVNSAADRNYGAGVGREVEPGFFEQDGHYKRFFDEPMLHRFLLGWRDLRIDHTSTGRFGPTKHVYQVVARRATANPESRDL